MLAVAVTGEQQNQILLGAYALQVLELFLLSPLVELQRHMQSAVLGFWLGQGKRGCVFKHQQVAAQQVTIMVFVGFARFHNLQWALLRVQGVMHDVVRLVSELSGNGLMQVMAGLGLHQAGVGRANQRTQITR